MKKIVLFMLLLAVVILPAASTAFAQEYLHPSGKFSFQVPTGWSVINEDAVSVTIATSSRLGSINFRADPFPFPPYETEQRVTNTADSIRQIVLARKGVVHETKIIALDGLYALKMVCSFPPPSALANYTNFFFMRNNIKFNIALSSNDEQDFPVMDEVVKSFRCKA